MFAVSGSVLFIIFFPEQVFRCQIGKLGQLWRKTDALYVQHLGNLAFSVPWLLSLLVVVDDNLTAISPRLVSCTITLEDKTVSLAHVIAMG